VEQELPVSYNGFFYVLEGSASFGTDGTRLKKAQVGWLDRPSGDGSSTIRISTGDEPLRVLLYAGEPQNDPIVSYGPFIGDKPEDIQRLFREYHSGRFGPVPH
jgi:redox-sensitive bicupin YhaK (pirin superfamily)